MKQLVWGLVLMGFSNFALAQRTQPCKEAATAVAIGKMYEKFGEKLGTFGEPEATEQVAPNGKEFYVVSFGKEVKDADGIGRLEYTTVIVTTWDPDKKTGKARCAITDVFGPTMPHESPTYSGERLPDDLR